VIRPLQRAGVPVATFLPTLIPWRFRYSNLRNHRKILVADGRIGFTGGMNIRERNVGEPHCRHRIQDVHFRVEGPVVAHLQEIFAYDWEFCTGELLEGELWFPDIDEVGSVFARGVSDGPDEDLDKSLLTIHGAISCSRSSVVVATPYFLPDQALITSLNLAAMRGVEVDILLPERSNLAMVQWATSALLWQVLQRGCRVWLSPPPFDHSKLMLVDDTWAFVGSANWDPRSLRLNFELNVECYDRELAATLAQLVRQKISKARQLSLADVNNRSLAVKLRDGVARLASPYL
jgi:cardiolipin synthase